MPSILEKVVIDYDINGSSNWSEVANLSSRTSFEGIYVKDACSIIEDGAYVAPGSITVNFINDENSNNMLEMSEIFPTPIFYIIEEEQIILLDVKVILYYVYER